MITGIIMASGFSKRMNKDKLTLAFKGTSVIERVIKAVKASEVDHIIMVYRKEELREIGTKYGLKAVSNSKAELGQSQSIKLGIEASPLETRGFMFFVADQPFLNPVTINKLIQVFHVGKYPIVVPKYNGKRGNPVIFSVTLKNELLDITGDEGGRSIIKRRYDEVEFVSFDHSLEGKDIDTWDEYMKWR